MTTRTLGSELIQINIFQSYQKKAGFIAFIAFGRFIVTLTIFPSSIYSVQKAQYDIFRQIYKQQLYKFLFKQMESHQISMTIPSLHAQQLIWSQRSLKDLQSYQDIISNRNFSFANTKFKDPFLLSHIKPDYGSLGQFMTNIDINKDFLMQKKKKNQGQEEYEQKKIRNLLKNKNLDQIIKSQNSSPLQRSVACKIMIEKIFQQAFGTDINQFYSSNNKIQSTKKNPININNLSDALDKALQKQSSTKNTIFQEGLLFNNKNIRKKKSFLTKDQMIQNQKEDRLNRIEQIKNSYRNLIKFPICSSDSQQIQLPKLTKNNQAQTGVKKVKIFKMFQQQRFELSDTTLRMQYIESIQTKVFVNIIAKINYQAIQRIQIVKTGITDDLIFFLCDLIAKFSRRLQFMQMKGNNIDQSGKKSFDVIVKFFRNMHFNIQGNPLEREVNKLKTVGSKAYIK